MQQIKTLYHTDDNEVNEYLKAGWSIQHTQFVPVTGINPLTDHPTGTDVQLHVVLIRTIPNQPITRTEEAPESMEGQMS